MNFLTNIKRALLPEQRNSLRGRGGKVIVNERDLQALVASFESIENEQRLHHLEQRVEAPELRLKLAIENLWHDSQQNSDRVVMMFSETMADLIHKKQENEHKCKTTYKRVHL